MPLFSFKKLAVSKACLVILILTVVIGDYLSFYKTSVTWKIPDREEDGSLCVLAVSDPQIQGFNGELPSILGYITRWDADRYLSHAFEAAVKFVKPDVIIFLGDLLDEGFESTNEEFSVYTQRFDRIFNVPNDIHKIYLAGDNDIGGEGPDVLSSQTVGRFTKHFGPLNDIINIKSFQFVKINTVSFLRFSVPAYKEEKETYNATLQFIHGISSRMKDDTTTIVLAHAPLPNMPSDLYHEFISKTKPKISLAGHLHKHLQVYHRIKNPVATFWEYVIPTCSYRMGTRQIGFGVLIVENNAKPKLSILKLPDRYFYLFGHLLLSCFTLFVLIIRFARRFLMSLIWKAIRLLKKVFRKHIMRKNL
ncbi:metallophosphoesterase 1-like [Actinia tenebrosa]|uniref:Metallophosphoesterase 1-like n=1 Tax=Actinia tenebrosa TaxID=6105 RepID=A0A6P8H8A4_ACTTE|nr:metallophosphoesterase 1-like [Actinia tenebrosa]